VTGQKGGEQEPAIQAFIQRWADREGGQERANYVLFLSELCDVLGVQRPDPASATTHNNDYVFERSVREAARDGGASTKRIDLYKRDSFVLEAKQSRQEGGSKAIAGQLDLLKSDDAARGRRGGARAWDVLMLNARRQAEDYVRLLPAGHEPPPFIVVCDVGHCLEIYANFRRDGKAYDQFPDRKSFRVYLDDLHNPEIRERLKAIWLDAPSLDPARKSSKVTREIAERLAAVSKALENTKDARGKPLYAPEDVAAFLSRCLFTMFAEDVGLLPEASFKDVLERCEKDPDTFSHDVGQLWEAMDVGGYAHAIRKSVKKFNGQFFKNRAALPLGREEIGELKQAASYNWKDVEPAIFGTLLEQALDPLERRRLGAHYTPRPYVERLVIATVMEPLRAEWETVLNTIELKKGELATIGPNDPRRDAVFRDARNQALAFHAKLCATRVLDPACGTGNFLYVTMELMKRLEGEVIEVVEALGGQSELSWLDRATVDPHQFLGLEINPRAAAIAELVLWLGYLQWHFRTQTNAPPEPILKAFRNIKVMDAVLQADKELARGPDGKPLYRSRSDGSMHEVYAFERPRRADWPQSEFIVGNPPFIPNRRFREEFGDNQIAAMKLAYPEFTQAADFVLFFWLRALIQPSSSLQRVGFISTSRLRMQQNRKVFENALGKKWTINYAIPDHDWPSGTDAAVRVCFVAVSLEKTKPQLVFAPDHGIVKGKFKGNNSEYKIQNVEKISSDLTSDFDVNLIVDLNSNLGLCHAGVKPYSRKLHIDEAQRNFLFEDPFNAEKYAPLIMNGRDVGQRPRKLHVLDFFHVPIDEIEKSMPRVFQYLLEHVKPERMSERNIRLRTQYWLFEANREEMRSGIKGIERYICTLENSPQRYFTFLNSTNLPDQKLRVVTHSDAYFLGVLSSKFHEMFSIRIGGREPLILPFTIRIVLQNSHSQTPPISRNQPSALPRKNWMRTASAYWPPIRT
jgi:hypothetical protein